MLDALLKFAHDGDALTVMGHGLAAVVDVRLHFNDPEQLLDCHLGGKRIHACTSIAFRRWR